MNQAKPARPWAVEIAAEAIIKAQQEIEARFQGVERKDMEGWLARFVIAVHDDPMDVLGFPPKKAASDSDLLYFPGDQHRRVSGMAHASQSRRTIYVYEIMIQGKERKAP